ncbi:MAG: ice-binding family protein [Balneolaceae bacterium]
MKSSTTKLCMSGLLPRFTFFLSFILTMVFIPAFAIAQPSGPESFAPADSAISQPQTLTLAWSASVGADSYMLQVSEGNADFSSTIYNESGLTDTTQVITGLSSETAYYWRVNATNGNDVTSEYSETWMFTTWATPPVSPAPVILGTAGDFVILAKTAISTVPTSALTGDIGLSPAATSFITGFTLTDDTGFSISPQVTRKVYAADMADPTPSNLTTAISNMETAFTDAAGRPDADFNELHVGDIGGKTLIPGLYKWSSTVTAPGSFEISGGEDDIWIFQIAGDLTVAADINVTLSGGAQVQNIFWQVSGEVTIGTDSHFEGIILSQTAIHLLTGASMNGRLLAQSAVTLDQNSVTEPSSSDGEPTGIDEVENQLPTNVILSQNYPNPFNPSTVIGFVLPQQSNVILTVYNMLGMEVAVLISESRQSGHHQVTWNAETAASGMYIYRLTANDQVLTGKMLLMK